MSKSYVILAMRISGDEYANMHAEDDYGIDRLFKDKINGLDNSPSSSSEREFSVRFDLYEVSRQNDRKIALELAESIKDDLLDYNRNKHRNVHFKKLSHDELRKYK